jgi:predicted Zn finger-like uncharacterized protein
MRVICPQCNAIYRIPSAKVPKGKAGAVCKKCGTLIMIEPLGPAAADTIMPSGFASGSPPDSPTAPSYKGTSENEVFGDYPELAGLSSAKFDFGEMFAPNKKGGYRSRKNKFKIKIFKAVHDVLGELLEDGEKAMRIGKGTAYYPAEIFLGNGLLTMMYNYYAIVCTNTRILLININPRMTRRTHLLFQMPYEDIKKVKQGLFLNHLIIYRTNAKRRVFTSVKRHVLKELREFITLKKDAVGQLEPRKKSRENLCPSCFIPLQKGLVTCPYCKVQLKEPKKAFLKSLLLPGWGDLYLGHRALGILEMLGSVIVWLIVITFVREGGVENLAAALFVLLLYNGYDGALTYHMGKKGYMLAGR